MKGRFGSASVMIALGSITAAQPYEIKRASFPGGGGLVASSPYGQQGAIGTLASGDVLVGGGYVLSPGFLLATAPLPTTTAVVSSRNPSNAGELVMFIASTTGAAPTGTVAFKDGATAIGGCGNVVVSAAGTAQCLTAALPVGTHAISATYSGDANSLPSVGSLIGGQTVLLPTPVAPGDVRISQFRFHGTAVAGTGAKNEFVELVNETAGDITVGADGWALAQSSGAVVAIIPGGTILKSRRFFLIVNGDPTSGFGAGPLSTYRASTPPSPASPVLVGAGDLQFGSDIPDGAGVAIFKSTIDLSAATRLDAVGFAGVADPLYREGSGLLPASGVTVDGEHAFIRRSLYGASVDTGDNAADFVVVSTNAGAAYTGTPSQGGTPGPRSQASGRVVSLPFTVVEPLASSTAAPNRVADVSVTPKRIEFRFRVTNDTGQPISSIRWRFSKLTNLNAPGYSAAGSQSDIRPVTGGSRTLPATSIGVTAVQGLTLEALPGQTAGGLNSTLVYLLSAPLGSGATIDINIVFEIYKGGSFAFVTQAEAIVP